MNKTQLFEKVFNENKITDYTMDDYKNDKAEDEFIQLQIDENRHKQELLDFCQMDPEHNYIVSDVKSQYTDRFFDESAKGVTFETIEDIYNYVKENFPGQKCVKIDFDSFNFKGCREVRIINDYDD